MELMRKLIQREEEGYPIRVGIIGCGQMGSGLAHTVNNITGMKIAAIADIAPERGIRTFTEMGWMREDIVVTDTPSAAQDAVRSGKAVVTADALLMTAIDALEANVEATGVTEIGALAGYHSVMNGKPIIMLNVETDITVGPYLDRLARKTGSIYTVASGDEPGVLKMLWEQARLMGFQVVTLGKGKNNPINFTVTPAMCEEEARSKDMNPKILSSFIDGTKTMVEMAAVSNATGLLPDVPGMHGPKVELDDLVKTFIPREDGGILSATGRVEYTTGAIAPGVFVIVHSDDQRIRKDMKFITKAVGPYYLLFRPYHLCDIETPQSIAEAVLLGEVTVTPETLHSEVVCTAKRDIRAGETVGGIGGPDWFGKIHTYREARERKAIPIGIGEKGKALKDIARGEIFTEDNFAPDTGSFVFRLRKLQDTLLEKEAPLEQQSPKGKEAVR